MEFQRLSVFLLVTTVVSYAQTELLSACTTDQDCGIRNSICSSGTCNCKPYFAQYKRSACLPARLLDQECILGEQCSLKVGQSTCIGGRCKCFDGFLQFRRHTCLPAAKPGDVCFNNDHCKLWTKNSHCLFLIPKLIGRCSCNSQTRLHGSLCLTEEDEIPIFKKESTTELLAVEAATTEFESKKTIAGGQENVYVAKEQLPAKKDPTVSDPFYDQRKHHRDTSTQKVRTQSEKEAQIDEINMVTPDHREIVSTTTFIAKESSPILNGTEPHQTLNEQFWGLNKSISLGLPCVTDKQCQSSDSESRCINNVCACVVQGNISCSRKCSSETFQCRSTGVCISWFFVCDGRVDCKDGSDEECSGLPCPCHAFHCQQSGVCVSRSFVCDGNRNCPNGEDEHLCRRNEGITDASMVVADCPPHSFQCRNGQCLPEYEFCNAIPKCSDGSDELEELCGPGLAGMKSKMAPADESCPFRCGNGRCRSTAILCTGKDGCGDNSDENHCTVCRCPTIM